MATSHSFLVFQTNLGDLTFELFPAEAPQTVQQIKLLAEKDAFIGVSVFRVAADSVIQFHDVFHRMPPLSKEELSQYRMLPVENKSAKYEAGSLALARNPDNPDTGHSSVSIQLKPHSFLEGQYTLFGKVSGSWGVLQEIEKIPVIGEQPQYAVTIQKALYFSSATAMKAYSPKPAKELVFISGSNNGTGNGGVAPYPFPPDILILGWILIMTVVLIFIRKHKTLFAKICISVLILLGSMFVLGSLPKTGTMDPVTTVKSVLAFAFILFSIWELGKFETPKSV